MTQPRWAFYMPDGDDPAAGYTAALTRESHWANILVPPVGLGNPGQVTEDTAYPRRDGVVHYSDWYEPRIVTLPDVLVRCAGGCTLPATAAVDGTPANPADAACVFGHVEAVKQAWRRRQHDVEAWVTINGQGPFALVGRPRVAEVDWLAGWWDAASMLLRFDCADHHLWLLDVDADGNVVGDGRRQAVVPISKPDGGRIYDRVYGTVYDPHDSDSPDPANPGGFDPANTFTPDSTTTPLPQLAYGPLGALFVNVVNAGNVPVPVTVTFRGTLTAPATLENLTTGESITLNQSLAAGEEVVVDTATGQVTQGGATRYGWLAGTPRGFLLEGGNNVLRLNDRGAANDGEAVVGWRGAVI